MLVMHTGESTTIDTLDQMLHEKNRGKEILAEIKARLKQGRLSYGEMRHLENRWNDSSLLK
jgi:hypothetical protein